MWTDLDLKYFSPISSVDNWGDPAKMDPILLIKLDKLRESAGSQIVVTSGYRAGDPRTHGEGIAVDIIFPRADFDLFHAYLLAERQGFNGIGVYPHWEFNGYPVGGLHLDIRDKDARWMGVKYTALSEQRYVPLNRNTLEQYGVL